MKNSFVLETFKQVALLPVFRVDLSMLTSLGMGDKRPPRPIFKIALKFFFHISDTEFVSKSRRFSASLCRKFYFFMIKLEILRLITHKSSCGLVDKIWDY